MWTDKDKQGRLFSNISTKECFKEGCKWDYINTALGILVGCSTQSEGQGGRKCESFSWSLPIRRGILDTPWGWELILDRMNSVSPPVNRLLEGHRSSPHSYLKNSIKSFNYINYLIFCPLKTAMVTCPPALSQILTQPWSGKKRKKLLLWTGVDSLCFVTWLDPGAGRPGQGDALGKQADHILGSGPFSTRKNCTISVMKKSTSQKQWGVKGSSWVEGCLRLLPRLQVGWSLQVLAPKKEMELKLKHLVEPCLSSLWGRWDFSLRQVSGCPAVWDAAWGCGCGVF